MNDTNEKISRVYINRCHNEGLMLGSNDQAQLLTRFLVSGGGFGEKVKSQKDIATLLYVDEATVCNRPTKGNTRHPDDTRSYGDTRLANLLRGGASFTPKEAEAFHGAFVRIFGKKWGQVISAHELVVSPPSLIFKRIVRESLPWPEGLSPCLAIELLAIAGQSENLKIWPTNARNLKLSGSKDHTNSRLQTTDARPKLEVGQDYLLQITGLFPAEQVLFVFEVSDQPMAFDNGNEVFSFFPHRLLDVDARHLTLMTTQNEPFRVYPVTGGFCFYAMVFERGSHFFNHCGLDPAKSRWSLEEAQQFMKFTRQSIAEGLHQLAFAKYAYQVS